MLLLLVICLIYCWFIFYCLVSYLYGSATDYFVAELVALCKNLGNNALVKFFAVDVHYCVVLLRVKRLACLAEGLNTKLFEDIAKLCEYHLDTLAVTFKIRFVVSQRTLEIVEHGEKLAEDICLDIAVECFLFTLCAFAVVVVFRRKAEVLILLLLKLCLKLCRLVLLL